MARSAGWQRGAAAGGTAAREGDLPADTACRQTASVGFNSVVGWRADRLRDTRRARGWTQAELAARVGVSRDTVGQWESSRAPRPERVAQLAEVLGVPPDELADLGGLRSLRIRAGMTQAALGRAAGVPRSTVQAIERGRFRLSDATAAAYAAALGVPVDTVIGAAGDTSSASLGGKKSRGKK